MIVLCWMSAREKNDWWMTGALVLYGLVFAVRYGVGVDSPHYLHSYLSAVNGFIDINFERWEPLFRGVSAVLANMRASHVVFFFVWAFAPLFCIFRSLRRYRFIYPYLAFTFMFGAIWLSYANGLRQIMAFGFFALSIPYLYRNKMWQYLVCIALAALCHKSAIILAILPPIYFRRKEYFNNRLVQFTALGFALVCMNIDFIQMLWERFDTIINYFEYQYYENTKYMNMAKFTLGVGFYINLAINILIIYHSNVTKKVFARTSVGMIYDLSYIGILINYFFLRIQLIGRLNYYFYGFNYIIAAFTLYALLKTKRQIAFILMCALYVLVYIATLYRMDENTALYRFFWEVYRL